MNINGTFGKLGRPAPATVTAAFISALEMQASELEKTPLYKECGIKRTRILEQFAHINGYCTWAELVAAKVPG